MQSNQWQQGTLSSEGNVAPLSFVQGAVGKSLSAQQPREHSTSAQATIRHSLYGLVYMAHPLSSRWTKEPLQSQGAYIGTYLHAQGPIRHLKKATDFTRHNQSGPDPVIISLLTLVSNAFVSTSSCQESQESLLCTTEGLKDSLSAPNAQKPYQCTAQALETLITMQVPLNIYTPSKQNVHSLPSTAGDFNLQRTLEMLSHVQGTLAHLVSDQGEGTKKIRKRQFETDSITAMKCSSIST